MTNCIIASTSTVYGSQPLEYLKNEIEVLFKDCNEILFIPYAQPGGLTLNEYTIRVSNIFKSFNKKIKGIHQFENAEQAVLQAESIYTGGGNTFLLVDKLYRNQLMNTLKKSILNGTPYLGTSAGSNICGLTMQTTNDMPIVYPESFKTLGILPFNINPHYLDPDPNSKHKGETRETRIKEFHTLNPQPVIGLREGSWIRLKDDEIILEGKLEARVFEKHKEPYEIKSGTSLKELN